MKIAFAAVASSTVFLAACQTTPATGTGAGTGFLTELPESVTAIAAGQQDMSAVRLDPVDGCYTYRHVGPVETTFLPLRAKNGRPICTR